MVPDILGALMQCCVPLASRWGALGPTEPAELPAPDPTPHPSPGLGPVPHQPVSLTMMQLGLLTDHRLTRQSSPPVASSRPEALPSTSEDTLLAWATISSTQGKTGGERSQRASHRNREEGWALPGEALGPGTRSPGGRVCLPRLPSGARHPGRTQRPGGEGRPAPQAGTATSPFWVFPVPPPGHKVCSFLCTPTGHILMLTLLNLKHGLAFRI